MLDRQHQAQCNLNARDPPETSSEGSGWRDWLLRLTGGFFLSSRQFLRVGWRAWRAMWAVHPGPADFGIVCPFTSLPPSTSTSALTPSYNLSIPRLSLYQSHTLAAKMVHTNGNAAHGETFL
jgi:hypothetical protein